MKYIYIDIWYNEQHYIHISVMSEKWMPKNKFSPILNNCWFSGILSTNTRWRTCLDSRPNRMQINLTDIYISKDEHCIYVLKRFGCWSGRLGSVGWVYHHIFKIKSGHIKRNHMHAVALNSNPWKWSNVKMYTDDISFQSDMNVSLKNILWACFGNARPGPMQTEMKWKRPRYYSPSSLSQIYMALLFLQMDTHKCSAR